MLTVAPQQFDGSIAEPDEARFLLFDSTNCYFVEPGMNAFTTSH
jgi:hypothetical protein